MERDQARQTAIKAMAQRFIINELKMEMSEWMKVNTIGFELEEHVDSDIVLIIFKTIADIAMVNVRLRKLTPQSANRIYQHVPKNIRTRFKGFEKAAQIIRNTHDNTVNTKIRPGKQDFYLLVRRKNDKTAWASIYPTLAPIDMDARFEVGKLNKEQQAIEDNYLKDLMKNMSDANTRNQEYKTTRKIVEYEWNSNETDQDFEDLLNMVVTEDKFNNGVDANSTLENNKRERDDEADNSFAKKKKDSEELNNHEL